MPGAQLSGLAAKILAGPGRVAEITEATDRSAASMS